jgi:epoxyqueuosine reductase
VRPEERIYFAKAPEKFMERIIARFVETSPSNRRKVDGGKYFAAPLVGFASADDPLFEEYKEMIGEFYLTPRRIFDITFGEEPDRKLSVISWVLPVSEDTRNINRKEDKYPSRLWSHTRYFGEAFNGALRNHVISVLKRRGYRAVAPAISPQFFHHTHAPSVGLTSNWSERHVAYACGLGTFGLCDGFITPKGKAMRLGSVVTDLILKPSEKTYPHRQANCLYFFNGTCKTCATRCPAGAITPDGGHNKDMCKGYMDNVSGPIKKPEYGVKIAGCGLCQTKVPCEFEIPKPIQRQLTRE